MQRVFLLALTNLSVMAVLAVAVMLVDGWAQRNGVYLDILPISIIALVFGMGGAFISLLMSKRMALRSTGAQIIEQPTTEMEHWLVNTVERQAKMAGIGMPDVAVYASDDVNAFATGASKDKALVAVSTGLLRNMSKGEAEAVLGHEVSHIANGDMVTLTLIQGVLNAVVIVLARVIGQLVDRAVFRSQNGRGPGYFIAYLVAQMLLGILASMVVMWFSRKREFRADEGGARLAGRQNMVAALQRLQQGRGAADLPDGMQAMGISSGLKSRLGRLLMTHPPLPERIQALESFVEVH